MDSLFVERLAQRDEVEGRFCELFKEVQIMVGPQLEDESMERKLIVALKSDLVEKDLRIGELEEILQLRNKDYERLNDELISLNIENNILRDKLQNMTEENSKLVKRWLNKVQQEADAMNENLH
ncbi:hypothetical protein Kpol_1043p14 [Vanderwaltozyma polyspora DSM 70294]|uniref:Autophagy-related protein 16 n=1 Tax=Vanderwaltozyma polyspora (strain ATCC 22028 / DSM 70294 / BCRC 21397 / CBS 2163 / NBRC 10782 / NRRL Y-8283 / UCD 57-17) TaxID=436907 RepID=ATG16_VANPO|nr:uncharacterized protein Kpol_1043p14 [Vanderwaltozyma polyspora DSM 70294]A7TIN2.1 RecName: Full=Autophagy-related protein 16 [Vanderwaltozyma polyspora DSM 70294]EDO17824.1 hypothetical protein Kpol_1043p14 [Vanderwaltozyma polyspora DSM 70294]